MNELATPNAACLPTEPLAADPAPITHDTEFDAIPLEDMPTNVRVCEQNIRLNGWMLGGMLKSTKTRLPHGTFMDWLKEHTDIGQTTANDLMNLYDGVLQTPFLGELRQSAAVALLALAPAQREQFAGDHDVESMTVRQLKAELEQIRLDVQRKAETSLAEKTAAEQTFAKNLELIQKERDTFKTQAELANDQTAEINIARQDAQSADTNARRLNTMYETLNEEFTGAQETIETLKRALAEEPIQVITPVEVEKIVEVVPSDYEQMKTELAQATDYAIAMEKKAKAAQTELMRHTANAEGGSEGLTGFKQATADFLARMTLFMTLGSAFTLGGEQERQEYLVCVRAVEEDCQAVRRVIDGATTAYRADDAHVE